MMDSIMSNDDYKYFKQLWNKKSLKAATAVAITITPKENITSTKQQHNEGDSVTSTGSLQSSHFSSNSKHGNNNHRPSKRRRRERSKQKQHDGVNTTAAQAQGGDRKSALKTQKKTILKRKKEKEGCSNTSTTAKKRKRRGTKSFSRAKALLYRNMSIPQFDNLVGWATSTQHDCNTPHQNNDSHQKKMMIDHCSQHAIPPPPSYDIIFLKDQISKRVKEQKEHADLLALVDDIYTKADMDTVTIRDINKEVATHFGWTDGVDGTKKKVIKERISNLISGRATVIADEKKVSEDEDDEAKKNKRKKPLSTKKKRDITSSAYVAIGMAVEETLTNKLMPLAKAHVERCRRLERERNSGFTARTSIAGDDAAATYAGSDEDIVNTKQSSSHKIRLTTDVFHAWTLPTDEAVMELTRDYECAKDSRDTLISLFSKKVDALAQQRDDTA